MIYLLYTIHVLVCLFLILVVLLQQGKGADLSVFGGGATQAAFGARGAVSLLHKLTVWGFVAFIVTTISIGFLTSASKSSTVMSDVPEAAAPAAAEEDAATGAEVPAEGEMPPAEGDAAIGSEADEASGEAAPAEVTEEGPAEATEDDPEEEGSGEGS